MNYWYLIKECSFEYIKDQFDIEKIELNVNFYFSNIHIYSQDSVLFIKVYSEIKQLEALSILPERTRSNFLVALWILSFLIKKPFDILWFQNWLSTYIDKENVNRNSENVFILNWVNININEFINLLNWSSNNEKILIYSLLDRLRKANHLSKESEYTPLYIEESILSSFHILELMSDIYLDEYNLIIENNVIWFLDNLSKNLFLNNDNTLNFINSKKKLYLELINNEIGIKNKILFLLNKLDLLNDKTKYFIKEAVEMRNWVAHWRTAYVDKTIIPLPIFFPLNKNPFFLSEDILIFVSMVIAKYLWIEKIYKNDFEILINNLPISLDSVKEVISSESYKNYSNDDLESFIYDLTLYFLKSRISSKSLREFINYIVNEEFIKNIEIDIYYLLIWNFEIINESKKIILLWLIEKLDKHDLRDILLKLETINIDISEFDRYLTK